MSQSGKLLRGLKWHNFRNIEGIYSKNITTDPHKMEELDFYLDFVKTRDADKVYKILEKIMIFDLSNRGAEMMKEAEKLNGDLYSEEYKKELKKIAEEKAKKEAEAKAKKEAEKKAKEKKDD